MAEIRKKDLLEWEDLVSHCPNCLLIEFNTEDEVQTASTEDVMAVSKRLMAQNKEAYEVLAE